AEGTVTLCAGGNFGGSCFTIDGWHLDFVAKSSLGETDGQFIDDIIALALEDMMRLYSKDDIEIARSATACANLAFTGYTHVYTIIHASRNIDYYAAIITHAALATTLFTGSGNDAPFPATALTHRHIDELSKDRLLYATNLASPLTRRTTRCRRAGLGTTAATIGTGLPAGQFNFLLTTKDGLLECDS